MTKAELVEDVARAAELTKKDAERLVEIVFESIIETLNQGEKIELRGFGSFRVRERGARRGRNPSETRPLLQTGQGTERVDQRRQRGRPGFAGKLLTQSQRRYPPATGSLVFKTSEVIRFAAIVESLAFQIHRVRSRCPGGRVCLLPHGGQSRSGCGEFRYLSR
jgi:nucleoid DNA-binding protein